MCIRDRILSLKEIVRNHTTSEYADDALMQLGDAYFETDNVENAYVVFSDLVERYINSPLRNGALLKLGLIAYNKGDLNTAIKHYKSVMQNNPSSKEAESSLLGLQEIYINDLGKSEEYVEYVGALPGYKISESAADSLAYMVGVLRYNAVSYTHLDVYKRQVPLPSARFLEIDEYNNPSPNIPFLTTLGRNIVSTKKTTNTFPVSGFKRYVCNLVFILMYHLLNHLPDINKYSGIRKIYVNII